MTNNAHQMQTMKSCMQKLGRSQQRQLDEKATKGKQVFAVVWRSHQNLCRASTHYEKAPKRQQSARSDTRLSLCGSSSRNWRFILAFLLAMVIALLSHEDCVFAFQECDFFAALVIRKKCQCHSRIPKGNILLFIWGYSFFEPGDLNLRLKKRKTTPKNASLAKSPHTACLGIYISLPTILLDLVRVFYINSAVILKLSPICLVIIITARPHCVALVWHFCRNQPRTPSLVARIFTLVSRLRHVHVFYVTSHIWVEDSMVIIL